MKYLLYFAPFKHLIYCFVAWRKTADMAGLVLGLGQVLELGLATLSVFFSRTNFSGNPT